MQNDLEDARKPDSRQGAVTGWSADREALLGALRWAAWVAPLLALAGVGLYLLGMADQAPLQLMGVSAALLMLLGWVSRRVLVSRHRLLLWEAALFSLLALQLAAWLLMPIGIASTHPALQLLGLGAVLLVFLPLLHWLPGFWLLLVLLLTVAVWFDGGLRSWLAVAVVAAAIMGLGGHLLRRELGRARSRDNEARKRGEDLEERLLDADGRVRQANEEVARCRQELAEVRSLAESASRAKTEFLATISHEIRTPLNGILPILDLLQSTELNDEQRRYVRTALNSSRHLLRIINDILDYAKADSGKLELESIELNLEELVRGVLDLMATSAERKGLRLALRIDKDVPRSVRGDPIRLRQILANLVSNAVKFTEKGSITVRIELQRAGRREVELRFSVTDTGIGLSREAAGRLFESFTQADASTTRKHGGTGLGLAICRRLVELMGGRIGVRSRPGQGSTFWFTVSLRRSIHEVPTLRKDLDGIRLLAVLPDAGVRREITQALGQWGVKVEEAAPGAVLARLRDAARLGPSWAFEGVLIDGRGIESQLPALLHGIRDEAGLADLPVIVVIRASEVARRLRESFGVQVIQGGLQTSVLKRLLHRVFDVVGSASYEAQHDDLLGYRDLNIEQETALADTPDSAEGSGGTSGLRVLLVEDNPVNSGVVKRVLDRLGAACEVVENGRLALDRLKQGGVDLVLMDCQMPVMDGYEATRAWREHERKAGGHLPIIAMTANAMHGDREKCLAAGMDDYLAKPVSRKELDAMLGRWGRKGERQRPATSAATGAAETVPTDRRQALLDRSVLEELQEVMGDDLDDLVQTWKDSSAELMQQLRQAAEAGDVEAMIVPAHSLKSSSANVGAMHFSALARTVEHAARQGKTEIALAAWRKMPAIYDATRKVLSGALRTSPGR
ncbi:ATP-binding protein [endosymbiont of unidentified scaly snail isolate Monju]|uniref:ATP-binding protein n=1 Tax=endosymbiont of unidentified scaly snail isolate Monju TaxID=1248727 RepID=UPI000B042A74|nr:ATP-binding protein [endosymbiont of unidentified scaly snail isolate Monju]